MAALYWVKGNLDFLTLLVQLSFCVYVENESLWVGAKEVLLLLSLLNVKYFSYCVMAISLSQIQGHKDTYQLLEWSSCKVHGSMVCF